MKQCPKCNYLEKPNIPIGTEVRINGYEYIVIRQYSKVKTLILKLKEKNE